jgi:NADH dehydrogenase
MAGAIAEISRNTLRHDFRHIDPSESKMILLEAADRVLPVYPVKLSKKAQHRLEKLGVRVICNMMVKNISPDILETDNGKQQSTINARTIIWAAGVRAASLATLLIENHLVEGDKGNRIIVEKDCSIPNHPDAFAIGDIASYTLENGDTLPGVAPVAIQQARFVARLIQNRIKGKKETEFQYRDKGTLAVIGRKSAVGFRKNTEISGPIAWLIWLFVHLLYLVGFENRLLVAIQWATNYFTFNRSARLIANYTIKY